MRPRLASFAARWAWPAAVAAVVELITVSGSSGGPHRSGQPFDFVAGTLLFVAAGMTLTVRRWAWPSLLISLLATVAYFGLDYPTDSPFFVGLLVTAYRSADAGARLRAAVFGVLTPASFAATALITSPADPTTGMVESVAVLGGLFAGQLTAELRARADRQLERFREEEALRRLAEERLRIARELHDVVSHSIAMINVQAGVAVHVMDERPEEARAALVAIKSVSRDALRDLRGILGLLRQTGDAESRSPASGLGGLATLADHVRHAGVDVSLDLRLDDDALPAAIDLTAYRVIQEALTNVVRHAPGAAARVSVERRPEALLVEVEDDGRTALRPEAEARRGAGHGLIGMRERVRAVGGSFETGARAGGGFRVRACLPLEVEPV